MCILAHQILLTECATSMPNKVIITTIRQIYAPQMDSPDSMDTSYKCYYATILMHIQILKTTDS